MAFQKELAIDNEIFPTMFNRSMLQSAKNVVYNFGRLFGESGTLQPSRMPATNSRRKSLILPTEVSLSSSRRNIHVEIRQFWIIRQFSYRQNSATTNLRMNKSTFAEYWIYNGFLLIIYGKYSKSMKICLVSTVFF